MNKSQLSTKSAHQLKYLDIIEEAIITLQERKGSTRQALWKVLSMKYPQVDYKQFLIRLKSEAKKGTIITNGKQRFKVDIKKKQKEDKAEQRIQKTKATMKKK